MYLFISVLTQQPKKQYEASTSKREKENNHLHANEFGNNSMNTLVLFL
jgi:hypothetical protein